MAAECCSTPTEGKKCCPCKKFPGLLVVLFGLTFLLRETGMITSHCAAITWPIIVIVGGAHFMFRELCKCCKTETK